MGNSQTWHIPTKHIYIRKRYWRFGFDAVRISQIHQFVKNKATGTFYGMYYILIYTSSWDFLRCSFRDKLGNARAFTARDENSMGPALFCVYIQKHKHPSVNLGPINKH